MDARTLRDIRHWQNVANQAERRARYLLAQGYEAVDADVQAEYRTRRLARTAVAELRQARDN